MPARLASGRARADRRGSRRRDWAGGAPLILGGDFNLRPALSPHVFARLEAEFGLQAPTGERVIDHLLATGLEVVEPPRQWPAERREVARSDGRRGRRRSRCPSGSPITPRSKPGSRRGEGVQSRGPVVLAEQRPRAHGVDIASSRKQRRREHRARTTHRQEDDPIARKALPLRGAARQELEAFRDALERSVTLPRERIQEIVDDAVKRGRMTRDDANELVSKLVSRGRKPVRGARQGPRGAARAGAKRVESRSRKGPQARQGHRRQGRAERPRCGRRAARPRRCRPPQGRGRLLPDHRLRRADRGSGHEAARRLTKPELRKVRTYEKNNKARKSILAKIDKALG